MSIMPRVPCGYTFAIILSEGRVQNLALKATPKKLLVGETLFLECKAETFINGRIEFIWTCPNGRVSWWKFRILLWCSLLPQRKICSWCWAHWLLAVLKYSQPFLCLQLIVFLLWMNLKCIYSLEPVNETANLMLNICLRDKPAEYLSSWNKFLLRYLWPLPSSCLKGSHEGCKLSICSPILALTK